MAQLQALLGEDGVRWAIWIGLGFAALLALLLLVFIIRRIFAPAFNMSSSSDRRGRPPRLGVTDFFNLDRAGRRLVIVRRDNVEHLVLVGGPNDILIESNIVRGARPEAPIVDSAGRPIVQSRAPELAPVDVAAAEPFQPRDIQVPHKRADAPPLETRAPEPRVPDLSVPELRVPEARKPEARKPEARMPDAGMPEARKPEARTPEARTLETRGTGLAEDRFAAEIGALAMAASGSSQYPAEGAGAASSPVRTSPDVSAAVQQRAEPMANPPATLRKPPAPDMSAPALIASSGQAKAAPSASPSAISSDGLPRKEPRLNPQPLPPEPKPAPDLPAPDLLAPDLPAPDLPAPDLPAPAAPLPESAPAPRRATSFDDVSKRLQEALRRPQPLASSALTTSSARSTSIPATLKPATFNPAKPPPAESSPDTPAAPALETTDANAALPSETQEEAKPRRSSTDSPMAQIEELDLEQEMARLLGRAPGAKP